MFVVIIEYGKKFILLFISLNSIWSKLRHHSKPSENFKEKLRADLFEKISQKDECFFIEYIAKIKIPKSKLVLKIERDWSFSSLFSSFSGFIAGLFGDFNRGVLKGLAFLGTGLAATLLILPLFSVVSVPNSLAQEPSVLRSISGNLDIIRANSVFDPIEYQELYNLDIIKTIGDSTAEIVFFDGSVLRLGENTEVQIRKIKPHSFLFSTGEINITLLTGNVWLKTFKNSSLSESDRFVLKTPSLEILPNKSSLSVHYESGKEWVYAIDNSAVVGVKGVNVDDNILLKKGEMIRFSIFDEFTPLNEVIPSSFYDSDFVVKNIEKDVLYTSEYLDTVSDKMQEKYIMSALSVQVEDFLESNPTDEELALFINDINSLMLVLDASHDTENILESTPEPTSNFELSPVPPVYKNRTYNQKKSSISTQKSSSEKFTIEQEEKKQEENQLKKSDNNISTDDDNIKIVKKITATEIAEKRRSEQREEKINSAVNSFSEQVDAFKFKNSRETTALNLLDKIPETEENIELLKRIKMNAPDDVKDLVQKKLKTIKIKSQKNIDKNNNIDSIDLHNSAPIDIQEIKTIKEVKVSGE